MPDPDWLPHTPAWMTRYHVTTRMLAEALNYSQDHTRRLITGKRRMLPETQTAMLRYFHARKAEQEREVALIADLDCCA